jgi:hypothetical protein
MVRESRPVVVGDVLLASKSDPLESGCDLGKQSQPLADNRRFERSEPGDVPAGPRQARDEAAADGIENIHENDGHGTGQLPRLCSGWRAHRYDHVRTEAEQLDCVGPQPLVIVRGPAEEKLDVAALGPAKLIQT